MIYKYDDNIKNKNLYLAAIDPKGCRNGIIPSKNEARDEAIRAQLLVGKLKAEGKYMGQ